MNRLDAALERGPLAVGDEAWTLLDEPVGASETRRTLVGAARVRVLELAGEAYRCEVITASPTFMVGRVVDRARGVLWATSGPEHVAFAREVDRFWGVHAHRNGPCAPDRGAA